MNIHNYKSSFFYWVWSCNYGLSSQVKAVSEPKEY